MRLGFALSLTIHIALLLWAIFAFQRTKFDDVPDTVAISVAVITPSDVTRMKQGDENTKNLDSKAADKPSDDNSQKEAPKPKAAPPAPAPPPVAEETPPPPPEPAKSEPPKPDPIQEKLAALPPEKAPEAPPVPPAPTPDDQAALAAKLEEERKAEAKRKADAEVKAKAEAEKKRVAAEQRKKAEAEAKKKAEDLRKKKLAEAKAKAEAEKSKFDPNKLADLINKADDGPQKALIDKSQKPTGAKPTGNSQTASNLGPSAGTHDGHDTVLSAREADMLASMLNSAIKIHWRLPAGGGGVDTPVVQIRFRLRQDGTLDGEPQVLAPQNSPQFNVAAEAAVRAIKEAAPYNLPPDKYAAWADNKVEFDPSKMLQ